AIGLGPVVGGFVSETFHWADLFLIPLLMLVAIPFFNRELPEEPRRPGDVDLPGAVLTALAVGFLVLLLNFGGWAYLAAFGVSLVGLLFRLHWAKNPFIPPDLFGNVKFRDGIVVGLLLFSVVIGVLFLVPLMLNDLHGLDTRAIGFVLFPGAMSSVFFGSYGGRLADRRGNPFVVVLGLSLLASGMGLMAFGLPVSFYMVGACLVLIYIGFSFFQTALVNSVSQTLTPEETGIGMGVFNLAGTVSGALGTAVVGKILAARWLGSSPWPAFIPERGAIYSNLLFIFCLIVAFSGALYLYRYGGKPKVQAEIAPKPVQAGE
ncbi:MAG TPA: MFS transporter, partial [bacterium]|nr:MFS transporter [bacterium]